MIKRDFIITSQQNWDIEIGSTINNTTLELSKNNRVLYLNTPLDHISLLKGEDNYSYRHRLDVIKGRTSALRQVNKNLWIVDCPFSVFSVNQLPAWLFNVFNEINNKKIANRILAAITELGFSDCIHIIDTDIYRSFYLKELIKPSVSIYYCRDFVLNNPYWKRHGRRLEPLLAAKSDIVITNSTYFAEHFSHYNPHTYPIETGVNLVLYDSSKPWAIPEDLASIPHPIIGYVGALASSRLDGELLYKMAQERPNYNFVFVGPEDEKFTQLPLHQLKNVYFLGKKPMETLPAYITGFDVCINPQKVNEITDGNYPLKIDEYLAMGKPTVATSTHTMRDIFSRHVFLANTLEEYLYHIDEALTEVKDEVKRNNRIDFAHTHSWGHSVEKIYKIIDQFQTNKNNNS
ncbi:glycosyltransferase [Parabacteroides sp. PF5-6]|uniref:glycosyltransferase n=1 Tax=Parabacteroides sp. PF5-6 TaxID=1742403 RepID=UPI002406BF06|nr:glycosyltransferase [Parabacteroides sp. PF5-6]MDF9831735.1 teichuronic acid biosynthesis glycosyltransferase TuaH [Parabacteroides sp. PF5-6]